MGHEIMAGAFSNVGLLKFLLALPSLKDWGTVALLELSKDAQAEFIKKDDIIHADEYMERHLYLVDGEVELVSDDQVLQVIKVNSERAKDPLFRVHTHGLVARALKNTSLLSLNEATYEQYNSSIQPKIDIDAVSVSNYELTSEGDEGIINEIQEEFHDEEVDLPSMSEVALKINQAVQNESLDISKISDVVQADPMISARAVQVANSAMYSGSQSVQTIKRAVQRIGLRAMRAIVMSVTLRNLYTPQSPLIKKRMQTYYQHSIRVGVVSRVLAKEVDGFDPEQAFLAGLIHDIGIVPILIRADKHNEINNNADLLDKIIHRLQTRVGSILLTKWSFEEELIITAKEAEEWLRDTVKADYCDVVQVAQVLCEMVDGKQLESAPDLTDLPAFKRLDLGEVNPKLIVAQAKQEIGEVIHLLE